MSFQATANKLLANFRAAGAPRLASGFDDLECPASGVEFETVGQPVDGNPWRGFRVVKVSELKYLPQEARADPSLIRKQASILRGLYAAGVETITLHYGVF